MEKDSLDRIRQVFNFHGLHSGLFGPPTVTAGRGVAWGGRVRYSRLIPSPCPSYYVVQYTEKRARQKQNNAKEETQNRYERVRERWREKEGKD